MLFSLLVSSFSNNLSTRHWRCDELHYTHVYIRLLACYIGFYSGRGDEAMYPTIQSLGGVECSLHMCSDIILFNLNANIFHKNAW